MEPISSVPNQSAESTIYTAGGATISGNVVAGTFIGRDQYNYYFIGLAPLVHDPTRRFRNFLNEYLGTPSQPVPFGGRQAQLKELHRWLNDAAAPPYYLMTAEAGRGKSSLVCRWMEEVRHKRSEVEVIFIPISIRFETAAQDTVFAALAARLAKFYDDPLKPAALSGAQWQGVCESYLDHTPPAGKQLLIILDGLDEATGWQFGAGFFNTDPPLGLRVVVTARLRVGESTPQGWAATLGWHERLTKMVTLPPLTRTGIEEALTSMGDPLAGFADQVTSIEQLYRLTEGDPLLVRLYVQEFEKHKATVGTLDSAALQQMTPGLQGYFDQWWKGQKAQWRAQGNDPEKEEAHLRLLLDALAAALGPVTLDDLAQLHPELGSSRLIRTQLRSVERWVIGDGKTQGYSYSHPRLGYYFWEQLSDKEQAAWDERFCAWGATTLAALNAEQLDPKAVPVYLLRHYSEHLERSHAPVEAFYALISNGWRRAWEGLDISYGGFLNDVESSWKKAKQAYATNQSGRAVALVNQVHAALCRSSVTAIGSTMLSSLLTRLVADGLWTPTQALAIIKVITEGEGQFKMLAALVNHLPVAMLGEALDVARGIKGEFYRANALRVLALHLPEHERIKTLMEALDVASIISNKSDCADTLGALAQHLPETVRVKILSEALVITDAHNVPFVFPKLAPYLPVELIKKALEIVYSIKDEDRRSIALCGLSLHIPANLIKDALKIVYTIKSASARADALCALALSHSESQIERVQEALTTICTIEDEVKRKFALTRFAEKLPVELLEKVLIVLSTFKSEFQLTDVLKSLASRLPTKFVESALTIARLVMDEALRASTLVTLATYLPESQRSKILEEVLTTHVDIEQFFRASTLTKLSTCLPESQRSKVLGEALDAARAITQEFRRVQALGELVRYLPENQQNEIVEEVLNTACIITDNYSYANTLSELVTRLPESRQGRILEDAMNAVRKIPYDQDRASRLYKLALYLPENKRIEIFEEILDIARQTKDKSYCHNVFGKLALSLPTELMNNMLAILRTHGDTAACTRVLYSLIPRLPVELLEEALVTVRVIRDEPNCSIAHGMLALHLPDPQRQRILTEALISACKITDEEFRIDSLSLLMPYFSESQRITAVEEALSSIRRLEDKLDRQNALIALAPYLPIELQQRVLATEGAIKNKYHYLQVQLLEKMLDSNDEIWYASRYIGARRNISPHLATAALQHQQHYYRVFSDILPILALQPRPELINELAIFMPLILALAGDEARQAAEGIYHAIQEVCAWWP